MGFLFELKIIIIKSALGLSVHLNNKYFTNQTLNLNLMLDLFSKDKFL